jgi:NitT/TauT family transport system substrate-binding protein
VQFLTRKIDVMSVYTTNELPQVEKRAGVKFHMLKVSDFGLKLLGASMYVSSAFAEKNPEIVKKLLRATAKGYEDAMKDPKGAAKIMAKAMVVPEQPDVLEKQVEETMKSTNAPAGKPIGWQESSDWDSNLKLLKETGGISEVKPIGTYYSNDYLK